MHKPKQAYQGYTVRNIRATRDISLIDMKGASCTAGCVTRANS
jgi:hypothetical protein